MALFEEECRNYIGVTNPSFETTEMLPLLYNSNTSLNIFLSNNK